MAAKDDALQTLKTMPDSATWDGIMYQIYVRAKIAQGLNDIEEGNLISHEEIKKEFCK